MREILSIAGRAREERRADALAVVTRMLGGLGENAGGNAAAPARSRKPRAPAQRKAERPKASAARPAPAPAPAAAAAPRRRGRPPKAALAIASAPKPAPSKPSAPAAVEPPPVTLPTGAVTLGAAREASDREALVLDAVRSLGRATAGEVAGRCGQPNGSVFVALRALVAHGQVTRTKTPKGIEYSIPT